MSEHLIKALAEIVKIGEQACVKHRAAAEVSSAHAQTCLHHTDTERAAAGCPACLRAERDALQDAYTGTKVDFVTYQSQQGVIGQLHVERERLVTERDRLRQALERIAKLPSYPQTLVMFAQGISDIAREALGNAKEDRP